MNSVLQFRNRVLGHLSPELRRIHAIGWGLFFSWATILITCAAIVPDPYAQGWRVVLELAFAGRLVSIADGVALGFSKLYIFVQCAPQDMVLVLVAFPWIVAALEGPLADTFFGRRILQLRHSAERPRRLVEPFGAIGLTVYALLPFWGTGPLVSTIIGYLIGLRFTVALTAIFIGNVISVLVFMQFLDWAHELTDTIDSSIARFFPIIVLVTLFSIALLWRFITALFRKLRGATTETSVDSDTI